MPDLMIYVQVLERQHARRHGGLLHRLGRRLRRVLRVV